MNKKERNLEIAFGVSLVVLAVLLLLSGWYGLSRMMSLREEYLETFNDDMGLKITDIIKTFHLIFLIGIVQLVGAILLIMEQPLGWTLSTFSGISGSIYLGYSMYGLLEVYEVGLKFVDDIGLYVGIGFVIWTIYMFIGLMLTTRVYREKYKPTNNTVVSIVLAVIIITLDLMYIVNPS